MKSVYVVTLAAFVLAGCGSRHTTIPPNATPLPTVPFSYDASQPLHYVDHGIVGRHGAVSVHDVSFASQGKRIEAFLVETGSAARRPAVVIVHGSGGDRGELLGAAISLARRGAVAMTITAPSTAYPAPQPTTLRQLLAESRSTTAADVIAVRRAADALSTLPTVDPARLGYLGWSAGAKTGTFVAASDRRFRALALLSAGADTLQAFVQAAPAGERALVAQQLGLIDPIRYVKHARPGSLLLEDGTRDTIVPHFALLNIVHAAPRGTVVRWYPTGHALNATAYSNALAWLMRKLEH